MKKYYLLNILLTMAISLLAQTPATVTLNKEVKVTKDSTVLATQQIQLATGFKFTALAQKGLGMRIDQNTVPKKIQVFYGQDGYGNKMRVPYNAVKIGEYYWIDKNFHHKTFDDIEFRTKYLMSRAIIEADMDRAGLKHELYPADKVNIDTFTYHYGNHYSWESFYYVMDKFAAMYDAKDTKLEGWGLPSETDFRQLFSMCQFHNAAHANKNLQMDSLNVKDVEFTLSARVGANPLAFNFQDPNNVTKKVYYFVDPVEVPDKYGFKMMPAGARLNGDVNADPDPMTGRACNGYGPDKGCWNGLPIGSLYHLFYASRFATSGTTSISIHDWADTNREGLYHWRSVRWRRPLTDQELGYKLYIYSSNASWSTISTQLASQGEVPLLKELVNGRTLPSEVSILRTALNVTPPAGYVELPKGYIRGFYVQYFIENTNTGKTVANVVDYARKVEDPFVQSMKSASKSTTFDTPNTPIIEAGKTTVYPNPVHDILHIKSETPVQKVQVYSMSGRLVISQQHLQGNQIDCSKLSAGTYIVKLWVNGKAEAHKIVKK